MGLVGFSEDFTDLLGISKEFHGSYSGGFVWDSLEFREDFGFFMAFYGSREHQGFSEGFHGISRDFMEISRTAQ